MLGKLLIAVTAIAVTTGVANATPFLGTDTFSDTTPGNPLNLTATYDLNPISFNIGQGRTYYTNDLLTINTTDKSRGSFFGSTATDNIEVDFAFSEPSSGTGTTSGTGSETVYDYRGFVTSGGSITWTNPSAISFADGALLDVTLDDATFSSSGTSDSAIISASFKLVTAPDPTPVPEPGSLALLGTGLLGIRILRGLNKKVIA